MTRIADYHLRQDSRRPAIPPIYRPISAGRSGTAGGTTGGVTGATAGGTVISAGDCKQADECLPWRVHRLLTFPPYSGENKLNFTPQTILCAFPLTFSHGSVSSSRTFDCLAGREEWTARNTFAVA